MAAKKKASDDFAAKMLSAGKVLRILEEQWSIKPAEFEKAYVADTSRASRGARKPSDSDIKAADAFTKTGDLDALMKALGTKNSQTALAKVGRVAQWRATEA